MPRACARPGSLAPGLAASLRDSKHQCYNCSYLYISYKLVERLHGT